MTSQITWKNIQWTEPRFFKYLGEWKRKIASNTLEVPVSMKMKALKILQKMSHLPNAREVSLSG